MTRFTRFLMGAAATALTMAAAVPAYAGGNIFLTGHDADYHQSASATAAITSWVNFVKNGSALPLLVFDNNSLELDGYLTTLGIAHTTINPTGVIANSVFSNSLYSAFVVASQSSCGGCDLSPSDVANIAMHGGAITTFFNNGGGILGLAAATDPLGYAYVPQAAVNGGGAPPSNGFVETAAGMAAGLLPENGDVTHNFFPNPGTSGLSSAYQVAEVNGTDVESIFLKNGTITCTGPTCTVTTGAAPEPGTWAMMLLGFGAVGFALRRRQKTTTRFSFA